MEAKWRLEFKKKNDDFNRIRGPQMCGLKNSFSDCDWRMGSQWMDTWMFPWRSCSSPKDRVVGPLPYMAVSWLVNGGYQLLTKWEPILQVGPASPGDRKCCWRCPYREMLRLQILEILGDIPS